MRFLDKYGRFFVILIYFWSFRRLVYRLYVLKCKRMNGEIIEVVRKFDDFILRSRCFFVVMGVGIFIEFGIRDYRFENVGLYVIID